MMKDYTALMIDLKNSKSYSIETRNEIQQKILETMQKLNKLFSNSLSKEMEFSAGDEIQGLFSSPSAAYLYFRFFQFLTHPLELYSGMGMGAWNVRLESASSTAQDGPAYHYARVAIEEAKKNLEYFSLFYSKRKEDKIINSLINAYEILQKKQSKYQAELTLFTEFLYPISVNNILSKERMEEFLKNTDQEHWSIEPIHFQEREEGFYIKTGKKRGLATQLSELLESSRQSTEKSIKAANIYEMRNLSIAILQILSDMEGEEL